MFFKTIIVVLMLSGGKAYVDVPYKGYLDIKALFLNEYLVKKLRLKTNNVFVLIKNM